MPQNLRRTKIVASLGPATNDEKSISACIQAGLDVARVNFSHGVAKDHIERIELVRNCSNKFGRAVAILGDLQGPKIRIEKFKEGSIELKPGQKFILDTKGDIDNGDINQVAISYEDLVRDVSPNDELLLDDGNIELRVLAVKGAQIETEVIAGGTLSDRKGINLRGGGISAPSLTEKDHEDIRTAGQTKVDYLALSFVRNAIEIEVARELFKAAGGSGKIIAKIERSEALENIDAIIDACDGIMIARGDLGVEIGDARLPGVQKMLNKKAKAKNKLVITATQMMESMIVNTIPTRAEVLDVANAVIDGTDAVMLSAETAVGKHPPKVIEAMSRICLGAERSSIGDLYQTDKRLSEDYIVEKTDEAIALAASFMALHVEIDGIVALTESGRTAQMLSRIDTRYPIFAVTRRLDTYRATALIRGVYPVMFEVEGEPTDLGADRQIVNNLIETKRLPSPARVIITKGDSSGVSGGTNLMKLIKIGDDIT